MEGGIHVALKPEVIGTLAGIPITNSLVTSWAVIALLALIAVLMSRRAGLIPGTFQTVIEWGFEYVYDYVVEVLESRELGAKFFPLVMTIFLFIFTANLLEYMPGIGSIGFFKPGEFIPLLRSVNTDLNVTLALAAISFFVIEVAGFAALGAVKYMGKFINFSGGFIGFAVGLVEMIGEFARLISLSFRLFGNIIAGEVLIIVAMFFVPYFGPVPLMMFELFIGFLQAAIFALLTLFFIKLAITEPHAAESH
ncbi:MAG: ATP synthase subunit a [Candidatus Kaiserbacteria bacterium GW2011_GWB1_52_6]|uniref:ATP synthase subunit a n=2 Tax=Candidatus Kaiseribacteriota TaxID=1752734 RepID=A0A0G1XAR9_9BACT|nr:MAG: ATP synthase subunit a [Candidatus Kaiserbacteria bacterium GW2011_GWA2_52_12]KKW28081.1 MAG: ATP synthase subunit a [Candidatus Kaiserbacteria bacterium GW2011_GWB1_52_6]